MTSSRRFEQDVSALLADLYLARIPDYRDDLVRRVAGTRQRPAWTFPGRWLPMELTTSRVSTTRLPIRQLGVLALIAILLATMLAVYIGTRQNKLPSPFGPAANGLIAATRDGDLFAVDPRTGQETLVLGGAENDEWVGFTPDGSRGVFVRWGPENGGMTAAKIGSLLLSGSASPVIIEKDVIHGDSTVEMAPNGRDVTFTAFDDRSPNLFIHVAALDGSAFRRFSDVPITDYGGLTYLAPDGRELVYLARSTNTQTHDIRALDVATGQTRPIVETAMSSDIFGGVSASPDGKRLAYALQNVQTGDVAVHVVGIDGRGDSVVGHSPGAPFEAWPMWNPQGNRLLIERREAGGTVVHPVVVDLAGGPDVVVQADITDGGAWKQWAPDGSSVLAQRVAEGKDQPEELWDASTGEVMPATWPTSRVGGWQRVAP